ncbi:hypothetical protein ABIA48_004914 [Pseudomonas sp. S30_BP2TU TE3576]
MVACVYDPDNSLSIRWVKSGARSSMNHAAGGGTDSYQVGNDALGERSFTTSGAKVFVMDYARAIAMQSVRSESECPLWL